MYIRGGDAKIATDTKSLDSPYAEGSATSLNRVRDFEIPRFHRISRFREISKISRFQEISRISWDFACLQEVD